MARDRVIQKRWGSGRRERRGGGKGLRVRARRARERKKGGEGIKRTATLASAVRIVMRCGFQEYGECG